MKVIILLSLIIVSMIVLVFTIPRIHLSAQESPQTITLRQRLEEIGNKYDRHFTLEVILDPDSGTGSILSQGLSQRPLNESLSQELEDLRQAIPDLAYEVREASKVIHVVDKRIVERANNPLEQVVDNINFEGRTFDFIDDIAKHGVAVSPRNMVDTHEMLGGDYTIRVRVHATKKKVRELLTDYVPLEGRGRLLWIATTYNGKDTTAYVRYLK